MTQTMTDDRLDWHFANWATWQRAEYTIAHGYPSQASSGMGKTHRQRFDEQVTVADQRCAKAVEALLDGCTALERNAVHHLHLYAVFRFPRLGQCVEEAYSRAREHVRNGLLARGIL